MPSSYGEVLQAYADALPPSSRRAYVTTARRFLQFCGGQLDREAVLAYIKWLEKEGYTRNTIRRHHLVAVKGLFRAAGVP